MAKFKKRFSRAMIYLILVIVAFISIFPCYWMLASAFNSTEQIVAGRILPSTHFVENLKNLFATYPIMQGLWNSAKIAVITVVISLLITSLAAYGFEKFGTRTSEKVYGLVLIGMMVPFSALVVPLYKTMATIGLTNSHWAIILPAIGSIFLLFFFRQSFKSIQNEILEAARIDGAGELRIFFQIVFPSMRSTYAAAAIYAFMTSWNNYMWPMVVLNAPSKKTIILHVAKIITSGYYPDYGVQMVGLVIATLPIALIFLLLQRSFVEGITGSVKG